MKEVDGLTRPNRPTLRSPLPTQTQSCLHTQQEHAALLRAFQGKTVRFFNAYFFYKYPQTPFICKKTSALSQRAGAGNARGELREAAFSAPSLAITPILLLRTVKPVKSC